jgi:hypothetical protein
MTHFLYRNDDQIFYCREFESLEKAQEASNSLFELWKLKIPVVEKSEYVLIRNEKSACKRCKKVCHPLDLHTSHQWCLDCRDTQIRLEKEGYQRYLKNRKTENE